MATHRTNLTAHVVSCLCCFAMINLGQSQLKGKALSIGPAKQIVSTSNRRQPIRQGATKKEKQALVIDDIELRRKNPQPITPAADMWLALAVPFKDVGPINCDAQYECTGAQFDLRKVSSEDWESIKQRLASLTKLAMSDCYKVENDYENKQIQNRCRFVRELPFDVNNFKEDSLKLLQQWAAILKDEKIQNIWVEAGARVDSKGLPLVKVPFVRPVALSTNRNSYLVMETVNPTGEFAHQIVVQGQRAFSFSNAQDLRGSIINVMNVFSAELEQNFKGQPLLADRAVDENQVDGELIIKRVRQKSRVIGRENFLDGISSWLSNFLNSAYETSTYTITWNSAANRSFTSGVGHGFFGKGAAGTFGPNVFVQLDHELLISADGVTYRENLESADRMAQFLSLYKRAVTNAFNQSLRNTCRRLGGKAMMANGTCEVRGDVQ
jgi:hypothetical protein